MTDTAVRPSIARIMTTDALLVDIGRVRAQLEYLGAIEEAHGVIRAIDDSAPEHLVASWNTLTAEMARRNLEV